jgi:hypothetical protein
MKLVTWKDRKGVMHRSGVLDKDKDPSEGFLFDPPDVIHKIDWEAAAKDLHNALVRRGLFTYDDVMRGQNELSGAILSAFRKRVKQLFREDS